MKILVAAIVSESFLVVLSLVMTSIWGFSLVWNGSAVMWITGALLAIPPFILNELLWRRCVKHSESVYARFSREVIVPLCRHISFSGAILIAVLSGLCEEIFFRGSLNLLITRYLGAVSACVLTSVLFAAVHFIGNFQRYGGMLPLYILMGAYLWGVWFATQSLACVAVAHGVYNFAAILRVKLATDPTH